MSAPSNGYCASDILVAFHLPDENIKVLFYNFINVANSMKVLIVAMGHLTLYEAMTLNDDQKYYRLHCTN
jgi:hypothetical protein